tara:strand:- start:7904 stop:8050 length:147 start_codon:yes stop_codon:yes gene_type:complete
MIQNILDLLAITEAKTENIKIAKGKYKLPMTLNEAYNQIKKEIKWLKK